MFLAKKVNKPTNQREIYEAKVSLLRLGSSICLAVVTNNSVVNQPTWLLLVCFLLKVVCASCTSVRVFVILVVVAVSVRGDSKRIHNRLHISIAFVNVSCITLPILIKVFVTCYGSVFYRMKIN